MYQKELKRTRKEILDDIQRSHNTDTFDIKSEGGKIIVEKKIGLPKPLISPRKGWKGVRRNPDLGVEVNRISLTTEDMTLLLEKLCKIDSKKWSKIGSADLEQILKEEKEMNSKKMTIKDLKIVYGYLRERGEKMEGLSGKKKGDIANIIATHLGAKVSQTAKSAKSLQELVLPIVKKLPLPVLRAAVATSNYSAAYQKWVSESSHVPERVSVVTSTGLSKFEPYYRPGIQNDRQQIEISKCYRPQELNYE